jgi:aminoglycoside 3-N-acetyltransferase
MSQPFDYDRAALVRAYRDVGVTPGRVVYVTGNLGRLRRYENNDKTAIIAAHYEVLRELLGNEGTLIVPTPTLALCNTDVLFDPATTASQGVGPLAEYVRMCPDAIRSFHPFWSHAGIGSRAGELLSNVSRHAYGMGSAWSRMVAADCLGIHIGTHPRFSVSVVHHLEMVTGVPYRYTKEFVHPVLRDGKVSREPFYLSVIYNGLAIERDRNRRIMSHYQERRPLAYQPLGATGIWALPFRAFFEITCDLMSANPYVWLTEPPVNRPYQE